ncbi:hypothetical protein [Streptomyces griseosporeus]|uniref:hypothetical protein n=1 Tax=Streptomyces griseosporeus TaxID=1910 RepID=UPI0036F9F4CD
MPYNPHPAAQAAAKRCENCGHAPHGHAEHLTKPKALTDCPHCPCAAELRELAGEGPTLPTVGNRYVKRAAPDEGRIVTVNRVWTADDGHTAVAYEWDDPRASSAGSACPLDVFHRTYRPTLDEPRLAVLDGRDALAFVLIRPAADDPDNVAVEAGSRGMSRAAAAYTLRAVADRFDQQARAEGDEPIPYPTTAYAAGLNVAADLAEQGRITNPTGEAEEHVNDVLTQFAVDLRRRATEAQQ